MLTFARIERLVREEATALSAGPQLANALRSYRRRGGDDTDNPWHVAGCYTNETKDERLVLEAFYLPSHDTCVVRVFRETPLEILYARKSIGDITKLAVILDEAAAQFLLHLKNAVPLQSTESGFGLIGKLLGITEALAPIPPPVDLADVES
jgi:hypothetical protein